MIGRRDPPAPARSSASPLLWSCVRRGGPRRRRYRLRRSPRTALSRLARHPPRLRTMALGRGLVGGISGAPVLPTALLVCRGRHSLPVARRALGPDVLSVDG